MVKNKLRTKYELNLKLDDHERVQWKIITTRTEFNFTNVRTTRNSGHVTKTYRRK